MVKASQWIREYNGLRLVVLDAARPLSIQQLMWTDILLPNGNKEKFVSSPQIGPYIILVPRLMLPIPTSKGYLDMGTSFEFIFRYGLYSKRRLFVKMENSISNNIKTEIFTKAMTTAGFRRLNRVVAFYFVFAKLCKNALSIFVSRYIR
jgi:D-alanyl-D-alanine dipeptidase